MHEEDFRLLGAKPEQFIALDILIGDESIIDNLVKDYVNDNTDGGLFSGPTRKEIETGLAYLSDNDREEFMDKVL